MKKMKRMIFATSLRLVVKKVVELEGTSNNKLILLDLETMRKIAIKKIIKPKTITLILTYWLALPLTMVSAEEIEDYQLLTSLPRMSKGTGVNLGDYLTNMFYIGIGIAGILAVIMITIGGLQYMTTEAISGKSTAKSRINNAIFGLILALASFLLLKTINSDFTSPSLTIKPVEKPVVNPVDPTEEVWQGVCRPSGSGQSTKSCSGDTYSACVTNCGVVCASEITVNECEEVPGGSFQGSCSFEGKKLTFSGSTIELCLIDQKDKCQTSSPIQVVPCTSSKSAQ